jgi:hypothetical protein
MEGMEDSARDEEGKASSRGMKRERVRGKDREWKEG